MGRRFAGVAVGVLVVGVVGVLAGCTGGGEEPLGLSTVTATPTPEVTPTPTPTPTPTSIHGVVQDMSDPELGIVFDDAPVLSGDEADVYNWVATFEQEYWRTLKTNEASPAFEVFTSWDVKTRMEEIAAGNTADQSQFSGVFHVKIAGITVDGDTARATTCDDYGQVTVTNVDGSVSLEELGVAVPRLMEVTLARNTAGEGLWMILTSEKVGTC